MEATQVIESAGIEAPRRRSPLRALVWKEWHQQRWILFSLAGVAYVALIISCVVSYDERSVSIQWRDALRSLGGLLLIISIVVLSANAFAGERDDNTEQFLETIPCSRGKLFLAKLGFVLFLVLLELVPLLIASLYLIAKLPPASYGGVVDALKSLVPVCAAAVLVLAIVPALVASFGGSVIGTILGSMPGVIACSAYMFTPSLLGLFLPVKSKAAADRLATLLVLLMLGTIFLAARRAWVRPERTWRGSLRSSAATAGLLIGYVVVPAASVYLYVTLLAPLSFFLNRTSPVASAYVSNVSPNGKFVTFEARYKGWGSYTTSAPGTFAPRAALFDVNAGRTRWLTLFRGSIVWPTSRFWSPSGNLFILDEMHWWLLWPLTPKEVSPDTYLVVDARSGQKHDIAELCPGLPPMPAQMLPIVGWYSEHIFALQDGQDIFFADIEHHEVRECKMPAAFSRVQPWNTFISLGITDQGIFALPEDASAQGEMRVLRYAPDLPEAQTITLHGLSGTWPRIQVTADGRWLLLTLTIARRDNPGPQKYVRYLVPPVDGAAATALVSENPEEKGLLADSWHIYGFIPRSHQVFLWSETEVGLFDADSHDLRRISLALIGGLRIPSVQFSRSGRLALIRSVQPTRNALGEPGFESMYVIADLLSGTFWSIPEPSLAPWQQAWWLGEDRLLVCADGKAPWVMNRDGTGARPLLK